MYLSLSYANAHFNRNDVHLYLCTINFHHIPVARKNVAKSRQQGRPCVHTAPLKSTPFHREVP